MTTEMYYQAHHLSLFSGDRAWTHMGSYGGPHQPGRRCLPLAVVLSRALSLCVHCQQNHLLRSQTIKRGGSRDRIFMKKNQPSTRATVTPPIPTLSGSSPVTEPSVPVSRPNLVLHQYHHIGKRIQWRRRQSQARDFNPFILLNDEG